jgi:hypothetical protein
MEVNVIYAHKLLKMHLLYPNTWTLVKVHQKKILWDPYPLLSRKKMTTHFKRTTKDALKLEKP